MRFPILSPRGGYGVENLPLLVVDRAAYGRKFGQNSTGVPRMGRSAARVTIRSVVEFREETALPATRRAAGYRGTVRLACARPWSLYRCFRLSVSRAGVERVAIACGRAFPVTPLESVRPPHPPAGNGQVPAGESYRPAAQQSVTSRLAELPGRPVV